jgi:hypothetical protein
LQLSDPAFGLGVDNNGPVLFTNSQVKVKTGGVVGTTIATFSASGLLVPEVQLGSIYGGVTHDRGTLGPYLHYNSVWDVAQGRIEAGSDGTATAATVGPTGFALRAVTGVTGDPLASVFSVSQAGAVVLSGPLTLATVADASIPNGGIAWSATTTGALKVRTPAGVLQTIAIAP